jgi:hypothetical protein
MWWIIGASFVGTVAFGVSRVLPEYRQRLRRDNAEPIGSIPAWVGWLIIGIGVTILGIGAIMVSLIWLP